MEGNEFNVELMSLVLHQRCTATVLTGLVSAANAA
jgi:hypothetical protein